MNPCATSKWIPAGAVVFAALYAATASAQAYTLDGFPEIASPTDQPTELEMVAFESPTPQASEVGGRSSAPGYQPRTLDLLRLQQQENLRNASQAAAMHRTTMRNQLPRTQYGGKPFNLVAEPPTISPYLNLEREDDEEILLNYFSYVRPQMEQLDANRRQQLELQRLESQVQGDDGDARGLERGRGSLNSGHSAYFMNTGSYYPR